MIFNVIIWHLIDVGQTEFIEGSVKKKKQKKKTRFKYYQNKC